MTQFAALALAFAAAAWAQAPASGPRSAEDLEKELDRHIRILSDWGGLVRYGSENSEIKLDRKVDRVVFLGDEITEKWGEGKTPFFPGKPYFNRGIEHQAIPQMLVRFRQDVISLKPKVVVIQGGLNDIAGFAGPATEGTISEHIETMVDLAKAHGIRVVLASMTPVCDCTQQVTARRSPVRIMGLNGWIKRYAASNGLVFADYYSVLAEGRLMKAALTVDGVVPNDAGYAAMAPIAERAIAEALAK